jgi:hypothetical protein
MVARLVEGGSAAKQKAMGSADQILVGDVICSINDASTREWNLDQVATSNL